MNTSALVEVKAQTVPSRSPIDREVPATIDGDQDQLRRDLAAVQREETRFTGAAATGAERIPVLVERLRTTEMKRRELVTQLERAREASPPGFVAAGA